MVLYAYLCCACVLSLRRESPDMIMGDKTPIFWGGSVTNTELSLASSQLTLASPLHPWDPWPKRRCRGRSLKILPAYNVVVVVPVATGWAAYVIGFAVLPTSASSGCWWATQTVSWPGCWCCCPSHCSCSLCSQSGRILGKPEWYTRLGSNTQLYAEENTDAANFIIVIIKERRGQGQSTEATHDSHWDKHSIKQLINDHTSDD
jgi:hypothetical protein